MTGGIRRPPAIMLCSLLFALGALLLPGAPGHAAQPSRDRASDTGGRIAVLSFDNFSDDKDALAGVMPLIREQLEKRGLEIADEESLNKFLLKERVRDTGYISGELARKLGKELQVKAVLLGSVNMFSRGQNPMVGISARLVDISSGLIQWANVASATGDDFTTLLGLGRIETADKLVPVVVGKLFSSFSSAPPQKELEATYRIAVMPFQNKSKVQDAGTVILYMVLSELFRNPEFVPVEYGSIRKSVVDLRIRSKGELDYGTMETMSGLIGIDGVLVGTVESYSDKTDLNSPPQVEISMRLIDARKKRILWYDSYQLNGDENITVLDFGKVRSVDQVAYKVVSKLIQRMEKAKWY